MGHEPETPPMTDDLLKIYLNDHLAGSVAGLELAERAAGNNAGSALGAFLAELRAEIEEDQAVLKDVLHRVGGVENPLKKAAAWVAEKAGRLKLNGEITEYSDLSRVEELEGLLLGVRGKRALWAVLDEVGRADDRLGGLDFGALGQRAQRQEEQIDAHRLDAAHVAFGGVCRSDVTDGH
jgi:hypothetical protein